MKKDTAVFDNRAITPCKGSFLFASRQTRMEWIMLAQAVMGHGFLCKQKRCRSPAGSSTMSVGQKKALFGFVLNWAFAVRRSRTENIEETDILIRRIWQVFNLGQAVVEVLFFLAPTINSPIIGSYKRSTDCEKPSFTAKREKSQRRVKNAKVFMFRRTFTAKLQSDSALLLL